MKAPSISSLAVPALSGLVLGSCVYFTNPVPEMPYQPGATPPATAPVANPEPEAVTPAPAPAPAAQTPAPKPAEKKTPEKKPAEKKPAPKPATGSHITQPQVAPPAPKPVTQTPAPKPAQPAPTPAPSQPALISNDGPIPVATRVPGDPLRVFNPLNPSKKIKITDKNGNPHPSGKKLRVPGTNFFFYVP